MSNPIFRRPKLWTEVLNFLPFLAFGLYALKFAETAGAEAAVIRVFIVYGLFLTYPTKKLVFPETPRRKRWFAALYTPHLLFGVWLSYWGCTHGWFLSLLYLVLSVACYWAAWVSLDRPAEDEQDEP